MSSSDGLTLAIVALFVVMIVSLLVAAARVEIAKKRGAKTAADPIPTEDDAEPEVVLAEPIKLPVTPANRAMRARRANVVWNLPDWAIADKLGPYDAQMADVQHLAELFADEVDR